MVVSEFGVPLGEEFFDVGRGADWQKTMPTDKRAGCPQSVLKLKKPVYEAPRRPETLTSSKYDIRK